MCDVGNQYVRTTSAQRSPKLPSPPLPFSAVGAPGRIARPSAVTGEHCSESPEDGPTVTSHAVAPVVQPSSHSDAPVSLVAPAPDASGADRAQVSGEQTGQGDLVGSAVRRLRTVGEIFGDRSRTADSPRLMGALDEVRLQSIRVGVASTVAVLVVMLLYALLPGHYPLSRAPFLCSSASPWSGPSPSPCSPGSPSPGAVSSCRSSMSGPSSTSHWCRSGSTSPAGATPTSISSISCSACSWRTSPIRAGDGSR